MREDLEGAKGVMDLGAETIHREKQERLVDLFFAASQLPLEDVQAYLEEECAGDEVLLKEVTSLLTFSGEGEALVGRAVGEALRWFEGREQGESVEGRTFGPYRIIRELGRGGLGRVFLAERCGEEFELQVALKIIDRVLASAPEKARFDQERRILASLSHPHIAQIFDGGATEDGTPYFVMELVPGLPVDEYCDRQQLTIKERILVFLKIAEAVTYAHRNLIIHRDLKPSNILVAQDGAPKLLDFGIAKVLGDPDGASIARPELTRTGELLLTPEYSSPEQVQGRPLTTGTDIYSLGALLFRLLTGGPPHRLETYRPTEIERVVCEVPAPLASQALAMNGGATTLDELARRRSSSPRQLRKALQGDLDRILATALSKEVDRRYASVERMARDLRSFLAGRPVAARGDSITYRGRMFVRRHRLGVASVSLIILSLLAGLISTSVLLSRSRVEQARTAQVADFMVSLFEAANPAVARGEELSARELLDRGANGLLGQEPLQRSPQVREVLLATVGRVYRQLGLYPQAEELLMEALSQRRQILGAEDPEIADSLNDLGQLYDSSEDHEKALAFLEEALTLVPSVRRSNSRQKRLRATTLSLLGSVELDRHHYEVALAHLDQALALRRDEFSERSPEVAEIRHSRAQVWFRQGRLKEAQEELRSILDLRRSLLGEDHPLVLTTYNDLATVLHDQGNFQAALPLLQRTVEARRRVMGPEHPYVATVLQNLATVARKSGDLELAGASLQEALAINRGAFGEFHPRIADNLEALGRLAHGSGRHEAAEEHYRLALEMRSSLLGPKHLDVARLLLFLGNLESSKGSSQAAEEFYRQCLRIQEEVLGGEDYRLSFSLLPLGRLLGVEGRTEEALRLLERALALRQSLAEDHRLRGEAEAELGLALVAAGRDSAAQPHLKKGLSILRSKDGAEAPYVRRVTEALDGVQTAIQEASFRSSPSR